MSYVSFGEALYPPCDTDLDCPREDQFCHRVFEDSQSGKCKFSGWNPTNEDYPMCDNSLECPGEERCIDGTCTYPPADEPPPVQDRSEQLWVIGVGVGILALGTGFLLGKVMKR